MEKYCLNWEECDFDWDNNEYTWDDVCIVLDVSGVIVNKQGEFWKDWKRRYKKLDKKTQEEFIKLVCQVKNKVANVYGDPIIQKKEIKNYKLEIEDIRMTIKEVIKVDVKIGE